MKSFPGFIVTLILIFTFSACTVHFVKRTKHPSYDVRKPVIYLYPQQSQLVSVKLKMDFALTFTLPVYHNEWKVIANKDGNIFNPRDGNTYPYLFWEGKDDYNYSFSKGFCVKGDSTKIFLKNILEKIGLNQKESNAFIEYWSPLMEHNAYNIITFPTKEYSDHVKLDIIPTPDAELRVMMIFKSSPKNISIAPEIFSPFTRKGFTVVEWGGINIDEITVP